MSGEMRSQGTEVWVIDPNAASSEEVIKLFNITGIGEFGPSSGDIITTNLDSTAVEKIAALPDNGDLALTVNVKSGDPGHIWLEDNAGSAERYQVVIGYSDGIDPPTYSTGAVFPATRTYDHFLASLKSFRKQGISPDGVISASVNLGISGGITPERKV